ncbi:sodium/potassium-transporting ATPase subunit beta-1-interacting protein isoform X1 [Hermetia illucens]|uniref:sodium/potassium-transporting ATPase subunit beta-1-interacting protein isoform X1 n=1 Tax=Hermetia illucens TaxID=343691 RepID=UPI0018CC2E26|nr:sodium/potassium-transporting ATPase subunit beta-1-interacting protein isoform X1 [Hermetia illucens]
MGSCTRRHFLLSTCFLQLITIVERQVFDFLGYMWAPIIANFFHIIFVIFGFYGAYHFRAKYIVAYLIWNFIWIGWNVFLICFYLDVGVLDKDSDILNLGTGSVSWFEVNGYGCIPTYPTNITNEDLSRPVRPEQVDSCLIDYPIVEVIHSGIQCILAVLAILGAILIAVIFLDEDDRFDFMGGDAKSPQHTCVHPMYVSYSSIPTSASTTMLSNKQFHNNSNAISADQSNTQLNSSTNPKSTPPSSPLSSSMTQKQQPKTARIQSRKNSGSSNYSSFINRPDIKYTQVSTEQLMSNLDDSHESFSLNTFQTAADQSGNTYIPFQKPVPIISGHDNSMINPLCESTHTITSNNNNNLNSSISSNMNNNNFPDPNINSNQIRGIVNPLMRSQPVQWNDQYHNDHEPHPQHNIHQNYHYPHSHPHVIHQPYPDVSPESTENYVMPYQYVTRSPNLNRISARRRHDRVQQQQVANFCDQIRDAPPGYDDAYIARAKSQDRLSNRRRNRQNVNRNNHRPRSYCDNANINIVTDRL